MTSVVFREELLDTIRKIGSADLLVGIPSFNNAGTIGRVVSAAQAGLLKYFPGFRCVIVNSDGGSTDGTTDIVKNASIGDLHSIFLHHRRRTPYRISTLYHGIPGKGSAFRTIFEIASFLKVKACAVVDSDLRSITPEWIDLLISPIVREKYDFVAPYYLRHKYDGTITNSIVYPLTRALYGMNIRQPIGGDFGFSGRLANFYLSKEIWDLDIARYGIDIWMTTTAVANNFRTCQSFLGAKIHDPKDPASDLSSMLTQVVGSVFNLMETYEHVWKRINRIKEVRIFGFPHEVGLEPVNVNIEAMFGKFALGVKELIPLWSSVLSRDITDFLIKSKELPLPAFDFPDEKWVKIVYLFAVAYHKKIMNRDNLLKSLTPLYLGKIASFVNETRESSSQAVEKRLENLCEEFVKGKPFLAENF